MALYLKLKYIPSLPLKSIIRVHRCPVYPAKLEDVKELDGIIKRYKETLDNIKIVDNLFHKYGLMPNYKQLRLTRRNYLFEEDVEKNIQDIKRINHWSDKNFRLLVDTWSQCYRNGLLADNKFFEQTLHPENSEILSSCNFPTRFREFHQNSNHDLKFLFRNLDKWREQNNNLNVFPLFVALNQMRMLHVADKSASSMILHPYRTHKVDWGNTLVKVTREKIKDIDDKSNLAQKYSKIKKLDRIITPHDFYALFGEHSPEAKWLTALRYVVEETDDGIEWLSKCNKLSDYYLDEVGKKILADSRIDACGHSGGTMSFTVGTLKEYYSLGWEEFVKQFLINHGIVKKDEL